MKYLVSARQHIRRNNSVLLYTTLNFKVCKINNASGASAESKTVCDVSKARGGGGGSPEERPYDVSRGQNRCVTLPLCIAQ